MKMKFQVLAGFLLWSATAVADLTGIPTLPFKETGGHFDVSSLQSITIDAKHCEARDQDGTTLIPPTLQEFAETFSSDLKESTGKHIKVSTGDGCGQHGIYVTLGNSSDFVDVAGRWTSEAYSLDVTDHSIIITGASPLGAWWGTRSVLQQAALNDGKIPAGSGTDAPGWGTRGIMVRRSTRSLSGNLVLTIPARLWKTLLPTRVHRRDVHLAIILEAERLPLPPLRQPLQQPKLHV